MASRYWPAALALLLATAQGPLLHAQDAPAQSVPVSLDRIRAGLEKEPAIEIDATAILSIATFRTSVEESRFVPTFEEWLRKEFALTALQRQSAEWGSKCCGISVGALLDPIERALKRHRQQRIREQIARELEEIKAAGGR